MFQFTGFASDFVGYRVFNTMGCPIRISTDYKLFAPPRSFSQLVTSFFASESLGIRHTPLFTSLYFSSSTRFIFSLYLIMSMNF
jgi:hypothetical protein